jgi:hypothetical protein
VLSIATVLPPVPSLKRPQLIATWIAQVLAAGIFAQTLFFKFSGAEESIYIFSKLGLEPWGRWGSGFAELICVVLLLIPRTAALGAFGGLMVITGAIASHLTKLGIVVQNDGGLLFALAVAVFIACAAVAFIRRAQLPVIGPRLAQLAF